METNDDFSLVPPELRHLIPGFLDRREKDVVALQNLLIEGDFRGVKDIGHRLKGTGVGYGFPLISDLGRDLEAAALEEDRERIRVTTEELFAATARLKSVFYETNERKAA